MNPVEATAFIHKEAAVIWEQVLFWLPAAGSLPPISCEIAATRSAGYATRRGAVSYNLAFCCTLGYPEDFKEVIAHELCHIVQFRIYPRAKQAHGVEFRQIMQLIGYSGKTYHSMSTKVAKAAVGRLHDELLINSI